MVEYSKVNVKLSDTQLKKTKTMNLKWLMETIYHMNYCWQEHREQS